MKITEIKKGVVITAVMSLILTIGSFVEYFVDFRYYGTGENSLNGFVWECKFMVPQGYDYTDMVLRMLPAVLLIIYSATIHEKARGRAFVPIIYLVMCLERYLLSLIHTLHYRHDEPTWSALVILPYVLVILAFSVGKFRKLSASLLFLVEFAGELLALKVVLDSFGWWQENEFYLFVVIYLAIITSDILLHVALYLFVIRNNIPSLFYRKKCRNNNLVSEFKRLETLYEMKAISEEEYNTKRKCLLGIDKA
ncbi:MAG: hypothetical protein E7583_03510 [Ruminococcaceae bacterium]|nr:hypothetical protein [Oscillospiraceae bacterium]